MVACLSCGRPGAKGSRCPDCETREHRAAYGPDYQAALRAAKQEQTSGICPNCNEPFSADNPATGGHARAVRLGGTAADGVVLHCRRCNSGWKKTGL